MSATKHEKLNGESEHLDNLARMLREIERQLSEGPRRKPPQAQLDPN